MGEKLYTLQKIQTHIRAQTEPGSSVSTLSVCAVLMDSFDEDVSSGFYKYNSHLREV